MASNASDASRYLDPAVLSRIAGLELRARRVVEGVMQGQHRSPYQGSSVEFAQHRPYVPGDDTRRVDWKVFGRSDRVYIKQYQEETNLPLLLVADASRSMAYAGRITGWSKFDHVVAMSVALAYLSSRQQDAVGLAVYDDRLRRLLKPVKAAGRWRTLLGELTQTSRLEKTSTGRVLEEIGSKLTHKSLIVLLSDLFDDPDALLRGLRALRHRKHEVVVFQTLDPDELEFPFDETTLFRDLESAGTAGDELLVEPRALRQSYLDELNVFTEALQRGCRAIDVDFRRVDTARPIDTTLGPFLSERMRH